ncbi:hypothetical protein ABI59_03400 [Acidobacteria bacterium Mor1]|nr:hypothetical protein ABI59_03400 [Acidobacteria bacterium Mor1]
MQRRLLVDAWAARPAALAALALGAGICLGRKIPPEVAAGCLAVACGFCVLAARRRLLEPAAGVWTLACGLAAVFLGGVAFELSDRDRAERRNRALRALTAGPAPRSLQLRGVLLSPPSPDRYGQWRFHLRGEPLEGEPPYILAVTVRDTPDEVRPRLARLLPGTSLELWGRLTPRLSGSRRIDGYLSVKNARLIERTGAEAPVTLSHGVDVLRELLRNRLDTAFREHPEARSLLAAMLLGERDRLAPRTVANYRDAGLAHLLAISGLHAGLLLGLLLASVRLAGGARLSGLIFGAGTLGVYAWTVGSGAPVVRAALAGALGLLGRCVGRDADGLNSLGVAAIALLMARPALIASPAFQLSFAAVAGILSGTARRSSMGPLGAALDVSTRAYLATLLLVLLHFGRPAPGALLTNLAAVPLCGISLGGGIAAMITAPLPIGGPVASIAAWAPERLNDVARVAANLPGAAREVTEPHPWMLAGYVAALLLHLGSFRVRRAAALALAILTGLLHAGPPPGPNRPRMHVLDVGQGQSVLLTLEQRTLLIDAGGSAGGRNDRGDRVVAPELRRAGVRRLDALTLTHEHDDHVGGAATILERVPVGELWLPVGWHRNQRLRRLAELALERKVAVRQLRAGEWIRLGERSMQVLHPAAEDLDLAANQRSLVLRLPGVALLPGDVEREGERRVLARSGALNAAILVAGHHGSRHAGGGRWLERVAPRLVAISAGRHNRFGHPHPETMKRLRGRGIRIRRTDLEGTLVFRLGLGGERTEPWEWNEAEQKHPGEEQRNQDTSTAERSDFIHQRRVAVSQVQQHEQPKRVDRGNPRCCQQRSADHQCADGCDREPGQDAMETTGDGVGQVTAVELPDGKQVDRGNQHAEPTGHVEVIDDDSLWMLKQDHSERCAPDRKTDRRSRIRRASTHDAQSQHRECHHETCDRARRRHVEEGPAIRNPAPDPNDRAEGPERNDAGDEVGQARGDTVEATREVVPHLVSSEDRQDTERKGQPTEQP